MVLRRDWGTGSLWGEWLALRGCSRNKLGRTRRFVVVGVVVQLLFNKRACVCALFFCKCIHSYICTRSQGNVADGVRESCRRCSFCGGWLKAPNTRRRMESRYTAAPCISYPGTRTSPLLVAMFHSGKAFYCVQADVTTRSLLVPTGIIAKLDVAFCVFLYA